MQRKRFIWFFFSLVLIAVCLDSCKHESDPVSPHNSLSFKVRWSKSYEQETSTDVEIGMKWCLSYLGAELPSGSFSKTLRWISSNTLMLDLSHAGFSSLAKTKLRHLTAIIKASEEYRITGSIDLGRFIALTLGSSNHYYAITGVSTTIEQFRSKYTFDPIKVALNKSTVSIGQRLIEVPVASNALEAAFVGYEGKGRIQDNTFVTYEFETIDVMKNGQLRVGIYDVFTNSLRHSADTIVSTGGKPAKCLWCHELNFNPSFAQDTAHIPGYYGVQQFQQMVNNYMALLDGYRATLRSDINFENKQEHQLMELLYISFMEPSAQRLALEWNTSVAEVKRIMNGLPTHIYSEFPFLGDLYFRTDVDARAPYQVVKVPESMRENSNYEPDFLR